MRGDMDLGKIAEFLVLMVVLAIGIGLITIYNQSSRDYIKDASGEKYNTTMVKAVSFSESQIKLYLRSCWQKVQEKLDEDFTCYILEGDMSSIDLNNLSDSSAGYKLDSSTFKTKNPIASISYNHVFKTIEIKN